MYPKPIKLIAGFYALVVLVGTGQIVLAFLHGDDYTSPTIIGFYMIHRVALSVCALLLFILRKRIALYWVLIWESATNIFFMLHYLYMFIWLVFLCQNTEKIRRLIAYVGLELGWNVFLMLISITIIAYVIATFKNIIVQPSNGEVRETPAEN